MAGDYAVIVNDSQIDNVGKMVRILDPYYHESGKPYDIYVEACDKTVGLNYLVSYEGNNGQTEEHEGCCIELPVLSGNLCLIFSASEPFDS